MRGSDSGLTTNGSNTGQANLESLDHSLAAGWAEATLMNSMPNSHSAKTPIEKFTSYSLNPSNANSKGKAEAYARALGYTMKNAKELRDKIHSAVASGHVRPYEVSQSEYGTKYKYRILITGPNGKTKNVIAVYQIDRSSSTPRMITNYVEGK